MSRALKGRLGDRLLERGLVSAEELEVALREQERAHRPLGEILVSLGFAEEADIARILAEDLELEFVRQGEVEPDPLVVSAVDAAFVRAALAFPLALEEGALRVAMVDPGDPARVALVRARFPYPLRLCVTTEADLHALSRAHLAPEEGGVAEIFASLAAAGLHEELPVERLVEAILADGVRRGATDVHVEPDERVTRVRYRIDGLLCPGESLPAEVTPAVVSRIKILAGLDISERRRPQDGRIRLAVDDRQVDLRVSILPSADGENAVVRILDRATGPARLGALGLAPDYERRLARIARHSHGLFLVTGPTGSGKTTTLYAMLSEVDAMHRSVATIEDPIECRVPLVTQSQVDTSVGYGFHEGLRSLLRQDPDVLLVGEIRDRETADIAIKASMTGHLVLSTLHTNSALGAIPRLCDIGIDAWLIEDALIGVLAQRLVRKVCRACSARVQPSDAERRWLGGEPGELLRGAGCERCRGSGYSGRTAIAELYLPDDGAGDLLRRGASVAELRRLALERGLRTMEEDGKRLVRAGWTTREEVLRVNRCHRIGEDELADL